MAYLMIPTEHTQLFGSNILNNGGYGFTAASSHSADPLNERVGMTATFINKDTFEHKTIKLTSYVLDTYWDYIVDNYYLAVPMSVYDYNYYEEWTDANGDNYLYACIDNGRGKVQKWRYEMTARLVYDDGVIESFAIGSTEDYYNCISNNVETAFTRLKRGWDSSEDGYVWDGIFHASLFEDIPIRQNEWGNKINYSATMYITL